MNPTYTVFIDVQLNKLITGEEIYMRYVTRLPYVPRTGDNLRLTAIDEDTTLDLVLDKVTYDMAEGAFVVDIEDNVMVDNYRDSGMHDEAGVIQSYKSFGFSRLNYPQGEGRT